jgi:hypothetical protein
MGRRKNIRKFLKQDMEKLLKELEVLAEQFKTVRFAELFNHNKKDLDKIETLYTADFLSELNGKFAQRVLDLLWPYHVYLRDKKDKAYHYDGYFSVLGRHPNQHTKRWK